MVSNYKPRGGVEKRTLWSNSTGEVNWARRLELKPGEIIEGRVVGLPMEGVKGGNSLILRVPTGIVALLATARKGHLVLAAELQRAQVQVGDRIRVSFHGWRMGKTHTYRWYEVRRV